MTVRITSFGAAALLFLTAALTSATGGPGAGTCFMSGMGILTVGFFVPRML